MQIINLAAWVVLSVVVGFYLDGQGQPSVVSAADGSKVPQRGRYRQVNGGSFCYSNDTAVFDGEMEEVLLLHPKYHRKSFAV
jgi:hypothetical protein